MNAIDLLDRMQAPLDPERYDWQAAAATPLSPDEVFQLVYAAQVEWGTEGTFASLDVSDDPVVKRFLTIWLEQEVVHAELLARLLSTQGHDVVPLHRTRRQRFAATRGRWVNELAVRVLGTDFFAVHMTWGAVNELTTMRFYRVLRRRTTNPILRQILADVMEQEALHFAFYRHMAVERLALRPRARRITRWAMEHLWSPVGVGLRLREDATRLMTSVFATEPAQVAQMDTLIDRFPGLEELGLVGGVLAAA